MTGFGAWLTERGECAGCVGVGALTGGGSPEGACGGPAPLQGVGAASPRAGGGAVASSHLAGVGV